MKKVVLVEIPYGKILMLPVELSGFLPAAAIVERKNYDWNNLTLTAEPLELRIVEAETIKPFVAPEVLPAPAIFPAPTPADGLQEDIAF